MQASPAQLFKEQKKAMGMFAVLSEPQTNIK